MEITYSGKVASFAHAPMTAELLKGLLSKQVADPVNAVNAMLLAKQRGFKVKESSDDEAGPHSSRITMVLKDENDKETVVAGTINELGQPRLIQVDDRSVDVYPTGGMIVLENKDVPGIIGYVGTTLGNHSVNIAELSWGRRKDSGMALTVINTDSEVSEAALEELKKNESITHVVAMVI